MIVHMNPGIEAGDQRVQAVKVIAKRLGLIANARTEQGTSEVAVEVYLKDDVNKASAVPEYNFKDLDGVNKVARVSGSSLSIRSTNGGRHQIRIGNSVIGECLPCLPVAGPCTVSSQIYKTLEILAGLGVKHVRGGAHKDRSRPGSYPGPGEPGYGRLFDAAKGNGMESVWTEVCDTAHINEVKRQRDRFNFEGQIILWKGARCRNQFLLNRLGLEKEFIIMLKHELAPSNADELLNDADRVMEGKSVYTDDGKLIPEESTTSGNERIILCVRGLDSGNFDEHSEYRFVPNINWIRTLHDRTFAPVCFDPCHISKHPHQIPDVLSHALGYYPEVVLLEAGPSPIDQGYPLDRFHNLLYMIEEHNQKLSRPED